ncbi:hypothetical protein KR222_006274 [Zaprionus bogoriensis]|nr:hypothetical protein KR222_006274 [Zaprionus bogoriensis]
MTNPSETILSNELQELQAARDAQLEKVLKLQLVLNEVRQLKLGKDASPEIKQALRLISISDYKNMGDDPENVLGLPDDYDKPQLSYFDRKTVRNALSDQLLTSLKPIVELGDRIRRELPDALSGDKAKPELTDRQRELLKMQQEQRASLEKLVITTRDYCEQMMKAANLKMGPQPIQELRVQQAQAKLLLTKAETLRTYFTVEAYSRTDQSLKAYKEVSKYLDELLANQAQTQAR